jgi:hypothetical protein
MDRVDPGLDGLEFRDWAGLLCWFGGQLPIVFYN